VIPDNTRMRCAACDHRWTLEADDELATTVVSPAVIAPRPPPEPVETAPPAPDVEDDDAPPPSPVLRTIIAIVIGGALMVAAGALWVVRIDPNQLPLVGDEIAALAPRPLPLKISFTARTTALASGDRLLEINGSIRNTGSAAVSLPDLEARLAGPGGTVRRWRIAPPVASLGPGASVKFTSTATGFPADATLVGIRPAR
jgi:hypothetical protein